MNAVLRKLAAGCLLLCALGLSAQEARISVGKDGYFKKEKQTCRIAVSGFVVDEAECPVEFANVVLLNRADSTLLAGTVSGSDGGFRIEGEVRPGNGALLRVSYLGYKDGWRSFPAGEKPTNPEKIILKENAMMLNEVEVKADRLRVYSRGGDLVTDVANTRLKSIGNAREVLKHVPGLIAGKDGYEVLGKGSPVIYIDSKKVRDFSELSVLSSESIKNVTVMTNPGAGYDADTRAVVRIETNRELLGGFMVRADAETSYSSRFAHEEGFSLGYRHNGLNVFGSYRFYRMNEDIKYGVEQTSYERESVYEEFSSSKYHDWGNEHSYSAGISFDFNDRHGIGVQYVGYSDRSETESVPEEDWVRMSVGNELFADNRNRLDGDMSSWFHNVNLYYAGKISDPLSLQIDADYVCNKEKSNEKVQEFSNLDGTSSLTRTLSNNRSEVYAAKAVFDYGKGSHRLSWGADYSRVRISGVSEMPEKEQHNDEYRNVENKYAGFVQYGFSCKALSAEAGVRYEYVRATTEDFGEETGRKAYSDVLPSLSLSVPCGPVHFALNFTNRLQRPSFDQLNNKVKYDNQFHLERGNPDLDPQKIFDWDFSARYRYVRFQLNYQFVKDFIYTTAVPSEDAAGASVWFTTNAPDYRLLGASLIASPSFGIYRPTATVSVYKQFLELPYRDGVRTYNSPYGYFSMQNEFALPSDFTLRADVRWLSRGNRGIYRYDGTGSLDLSVQKTFLDGNLSLSLRGEDLLNWSRTSDVKYVNYIVSSRDVNSYGRKVLLSVSWNFNHFKKQYKGSSAAGDEMDRL